MEDRKLRSGDKENPRFYLLDCTVTAGHRKIEGVRLPTGRQVVLCFLANLTKNDIDKGVTYRDAANATVQQILPFYQRA